ncbi:MAG: hypothetical protein UV80_C0001G0112 [Candidatus Peregrinibacteria bacterium GW2011_GWF2_43_17]|nr:MAG: hypothetical protein UV80_C0001G0112 [Candidatus Peregrinibacteria bacterium GW2011_GWF2_43_17]
MAKTLATTLTILFVSTITTGCIVSLFALATAGANYALALQ